MGRILIYGAYGYTGKLILQEALEVGLNPILAGRNPGKTKALAKAHGLDFRSFDLGNSSAITTGLKGISLVIHAAGPFIHTAKPMVKACLESGVHYLDITGEIPVFDWISRQHEVAVSAGICLMPGVGFDVVPTDCMAKKLHQAMPDATHLELAFAGLGAGISHGTMMTMVENLGNPGAIRADGQMVSQAIGKEGKVIDFGLKKRFCMSIPWGDVATAFHTTGIPNIKVFTAVSKNAYRFMKLQPIYNPLLRLPWIKEKIKSYVDRKITGPTALENEKGITLVWGKVKNAIGEEITLRLKTRAGYLLTAKMAVLLAEKVLKTQPIGYQTPAGCFGSELILEIPGSSYLD